MTAAVIATQLTTPDTTRSYTVTVNSATDLQSIYHRSLVLEDQGTNVKATTSFEIRGVTLASLPNVRGQALLEIYDHVSDSMAFRGVVDSHEPDQQGTLDVIKIIASDHTSLLDNIIPFEARPAGESDAARIKYLLAAYVKNATDEEAITDFYLTDDSSGLFRNAFFTEPRTYGVSIQKRF